LTYRPKWQRGNPETFCVLPNSDMTQSISLKPPPGNNGEISSHQSALENFNMVGRVLLTCV
jgi:hypothetical protein